MTPQTGGAAERDAPWEGVEARLNRMATHPLTRIADDIRRCC